MTENRKNTLYTYFSSPTKRQKSASEDDSSMQSVCDESVLLVSHSIAEEDDKELSEPFSSRHADVRKEDRYNFLVQVRDKNGVAKDEPGYDSSTLFIPPESYSRFTDFERQFWDIKKEYYDTVIFFKKGKFYELYENDADTASALFDLKVVERVNMKMAGVPEKSYEYWAGKFLEKGLKIGRVDQVENMVAKNIRERESCAKDKIIRRELKEIVTSGTIYNNDHLKSPISVYLGVVEMGECVNEHCKSAQHVSVLLYEASLNKVFFDSFCDDSESTALRTLFAQNDVREVISSGKIKTDGYVRMIAPITGGSQVSFRDRFNNYREYKCFVYLANHMEFLKRGCFVDSVEIVPAKCDVRTTFGLDRITLKNMEILANNYDQTTKNTLFEHINHCVTPFGQRLLKVWLLHPLKDVGEIVKRQQITQALESTHFYTLREKLKGMGDVERIMGKCNSSNPLPKDVMDLIKNLGVAMGVKKDLVLLVDAAHHCMHDQESGKSNGSSLLGSIIDSFPDIQGIMDTFNASFYCEGDEIMPHENASDELCMLLTAQKKILTRIDAYLASQKRALGVEIRFRDIGKEIFQMEMQNDVKVPENYFVVSSTKSAKRFYTKELKCIINEYVECGERVFQSRGNLLRRVIAFLLQFKSHLYALSTTLAQLDVFLSFAIFSSSRKSIFPTFGNDLRAQGLRNPIFPHFVESDLSLLDTNVLLLTGPNMGGKSTLLRSLCYNVILAQMGMKVLATTFETRIFDNIFTRIGAYDNLEKGESTFMVELSETAKILRSSTANTFIIIDELGRGTSVDDGEAIARAVVEHLTRVGCTVFFSTHYHKMVEEVAGVSKGYMDYEVSGDDVVFLYKLVEGIADSSHGISVAKMAAIPSRIIEKAKEIRHRIVSGGKP